MFFCPPGDDVIQADVLQGLAGKQLLVEAQRSAWRQPGGKAGDVLRHSGSVHRRHARLHRAHVLQLPPARAVPGLQVRSGTVER